MRKLFYLAVLTVGLSVAAACGGDDETTSPTAAPAAPTAPTAAPVATVVPPPAAIEPTTPPATDEPAAPSNGLIRVTSVNQDPGGPGGEYTFKPDQFTFNVGDVVEFTLIAESEFHTFTVDDLGIDVSMDGGSTQTMTYTFDKPGEFKLLCIPHELLGMVGSITVLP